MKSTPPRRLTRQKRSPLLRSPIKKKRRKPAEAERIYGPPDRREWVTTLPCAACGLIGYSQNAHVLPNKSKGRKGDAKGIAPLCSDASPMRCHSRFDRYEHPFERDSEERARIQRCAAIVQTMWENINGA